MTREYPTRPFVAVGAVVVHDRGVVLVRRRQPPLADAWSLPGGAVELGEPLDEAVTREILEETGLHVRVGAVVDVLDRITHDVTGRVQYHYVLVDYLCWSNGGVLAAGSDVSEVTVAHPGDLGRYDLADAARSVIDRALQMAARGEVAIVSPECG
jgi:8-oxo-dGTP diphosphatase